MILSTRQVYLLRLGKPRIPCNLGGDSSSDSSVATKNDTSNVANSWDKRNVVSDSAVGLTGDGNMVDRSASTITSMMDSSSTSTITSMMDSSNKSTNFNDSSSTNSSTNFSDSSIRDSSTNFTDNRIDASTKIDNSNKSTNFTDNSTKSDLGAISAAMGLAATATNGMGSVANNSIDGVMGVMKQQSYDSQQGVMAAFELARSSGSTTAKNSSDVLGFASQAIEKTSAAMNDAKDGNQSKMVMTALIVIGAIGVAYALK